MKYWTDFLPNRTHRLKRLSQIKRAMDYNLMEAKMYVEMLEKGSDVLENQIINQAIKSNTEEHIQQAIQKAEKWNDTPKPELLNPNNKIEQ